jgi:hypothetical protein
MVYQNTKHDLVFDNLQVSLEGTVFGNGKDHIGNYQCQGVLKQEGQIHFVKRYQQGVQVSFHGQLGSNKITGNWSHRNNNSGKFEIFLLEVANWNGTYSQRGKKEEQQFEIVFGYEGIFGAGCDNYGAFIIRGNLHKVSGQAVFGKQYLGRHVVVYTGGVIMAGPSWTISGNWQIPNNSMGVFNLKRSPPSHPPVFQSGYQMPTQAFWDQQQ